MTWPLVATRQLTEKDYTIAWICALPIEKTAARNMLDELHENFVQPKHDKNIYTLGSIFGHNVVIVCQGDMGTVAAATVATRMDGTFSGLRFGLMVGIGGGVPDEKDVRLGDVVISKGNGVFGGVFDRDRGKTTEVEGSDGNKSTEVEGSDKKTEVKFQAKPFLNGVPELLRNAFVELDSLLEGGENSIPKYISDATTRNSLFQQFHQPALEDNLFKVGYLHVDPRDDQCAQCQKDDDHLVSRKNRTNVKDVHFGLVSSGNDVIKNSTERAKIVKDFPDTLAVEMEASGIMNIFGCATIRGICDYADSHKNDSWQKYAAARAAACAKEVLRIIPKVQLEATPSIPVASE